MVRWLAVLYAWIGLGSGCGGFDPLGSASRELVVSVLYFDNHTRDPELEVLGKGIADMMITDLARLEGLKVVERARLQEIIGELEVQQTEFFDPATAQRIGKLLGATHAVTGAITTYAPQMRIDIRLVDVSTAQIDLTDSVAGDKNEFFTLQEELSTKFTTALGQEPSLIPPPDRIDDADLVLEYSRGLERLDQGDLTAAYDLIEKLVKRVPTFQTAARQRDAIADRLDRARAQRDRLLNEDQRELLQNADAVLAGDVTRLSDRRVREWFGYRQVRGALFLQAAEGLLTDPVIPVGFQQKTVARKDRALFVAMLEQWRDNTLAMNREIRAYYAARKRFPRQATLPDDDYQRADVIRVDWSLLLGEPDKHAIALGKVLCAGKPPVTRVFGMSPVPVEMESGLAGPLLEEFDRTLADMSVFQRHHERQSMRLLAQYGQCLLALDRRPEALKLWQNALETYPKSSEYDRIEKLIREHF